VRILVLPLSLVFLSGCVPVGFTLASYAVDGVSYVGSGKSLTDHMLSDWKGRDCATWRIIKSRPICKDFTPEEIAQRKKNKESIRHDIGHAYIATNLDGIDLDDGTMRATTTKTNARVNAKARSVHSVSPAIVGKPAPAKANEGPVRLQPAPVKREDLPAAGPGERKPIAKRPVQPVALQKTHDARPVRTARRMPTDSRYLVFGSFRHRSEAKRFAGRHKVMRPTILPVQVRGKRYYRVVVRAEGRQALASARQQLRRNGVRDAYTMRICRLGSASSRRSAHCM